MKKFSRRDWLKATGYGLGAISLPSVGLVTAQAAEPPPKLLFLYAEGGWTSRFMDMRPPWAPAQWSSYQFYDYATNGLVPDALEWEFELNDSRLTEADFTRVLKPLYRHADVMTVTEGLAMLTAALDPYGDNHAKAHLHAWSAVAAASEDAPKSRGSAPSLDQRIHEFIRQSDPAHQSMDLRVIEPDLYHEWLYMSDGNGGAARLPTILDPWVAYDRFFGGAMGSA